MKSWLCPCLVGRDVGEAMDGDGGKCCLGYLAAMCIGILVSIIVFIQKANKLITRDWDYVTI